jgi:hypothetical protein
MAKTILRKTPSKVAIKVAGGVGTDTIVLATDLLHNTEEVVGTPTVNILALHWTGAATGVATITRNGTVIATLLGQTAGELLFNDAEFVDNVANTDDIVVTISGGQMEVWMQLRKQHGYSSKLETAEFSVYDNVNVVGS